MTRSFREIAGYVLASGCAFVLDVAALMTLVQFAGMHYLLAATLSFAGGTVVTYLLVTRFVFGHRRLADRRAEFALFATIGAIGLFVNAAVMYLAVEYLSATHLLAKIIAAGVTVCSNYLMRRRVLFTPIIPLRTHTCVGIEEIS